MQFFNNNPFVKILSFEIAGMLSANFLPFSGKLYLLTLLILAIWLVKLRLYRSHTFHAVYSSLLAVIVMALSFAITLKHNDQGGGIESGKQKTDNSADTDKQQHDRQAFVPSQYFFEAVVLDKPTEKPNSFQAVIQIKNTGNSGIRKQKALAYLEKSDKSRNLTSGDVIFARSWINEVQNSGNPYEFDYKKYLERKNIRHTTYIASENFSVMPVDGLPFFSFIERWREKLISNLRSKIGNNEAFQVISALTLGYREELSPEIRSRFIITGAIHILAVSGLHVGLILMLLNFVLAFLKRSGTGRVLYAILIITCLWGYALITGFAPPVQRATIMFTFVQFGSMVNRKTSIYNSIAASAFLILLLNPNIFWEIGFQLSYMAVITIVFFYKRLVKLFKTRQPIVRWAWQLLCVSISAQIGVFPLSVYYFHQFPVYFWLSNFVVIPAAYLLMGLTFAFFIFSPIGPVTDVIAWLLRKITNSTLFLLQEIGNFPSPLIEGFSISVVGLLFFLSAIVLFMFFIKHKKRVFLIAGLSLLLLFQVTGLVEKIRLTDQKKLIVYNSKEKVIHLINGRTNYLITENGNEPSPYLYGNVIVKLKLQPPIFIDTGNANKTDYPDLFINDKIIQFTDKTLILPGSGLFLPGNNLPGQITLDTIHFQSGILDLKRIEAPVIFID